MIRQCNRENVKVFAICRNYIFSKNMTKVLFRNILSSVRLIITYYMCYVNCRIQNEGNSVFENNMTRIRKECSDMVISLIN